MDSYKQHFAAALEGLGDTLHFAAHSHHLWPDVTRDAMLACWHDGAALNDAKWGKVFSEVVPQAQQRIAQTLSLPDPQQIVFGPNVHGFFTRLLSCLPTDRPPRILSTDGEFHSFSRQAKRLLEDGLIELHVVPCDPFETLHDRVCSSLSSHRYDLVYLSQVFFDSGRGLPGLESIVRAVRDEDTLVAIDGYHGFMAVPTDLSSIADRVFYLAGGYKYAMSGEGCCFMAVPPGCALRPRDTGWYASFATLADESGRVGYAKDGWRFAGATFDPAGLYRMNAVFDLLEKLGLTIETMHERAVALQVSFLEQLRSLCHPKLNPDALLGSPGVGYGRFLTFDLGNAGAAGDLTQALAHAGVRIDSRGSRVRFGFGLYHDLDDIDRLIERLQHIHTGVA
ncbi:MAG: aminotransferase class V-fold PLP-dependent enzyme [Phycisphaerales bacterium JB063]